MPDDHKSGPLEARPLLELLETAEELERAERLRAGAGMQVRAAREARSWRQSDLAHHLGTSQAYVSSVESGKTPVTPDFDRFYPMPIYEFNCSCGATFEVIQPRTESDGKSP